MRFLRNVLWTLTFVAHGAVYAGSSIVDGITVPHSVVLEAVTQNSRSSVANDVEVVSVKPLLFGTMFADWARLKLKCGRFSGLDAT